MTARGLSINKHFIVFLSPGNGAAGGEGHQQRHRPTQPGGGHAQGAGVHIYWHPAARSDRYTYVNDIRISRDEKISPADEWHTLIILYF